jgi:hypothetical protein
MNHGNRCSTEPTVYVEFGKAFTSALLLSGLILMSEFYFMPAGSKSQTSLIKILARNTALATSVGIASAANLVLVRRKELTEGINIEDSKGEKVLGKSKLAAQSAIVETASTRFLLFFPTALMMTLFSTSGASRSLAFKTF